MVNTDLFELGSSFSNTWPRQNTTFELQKIMGLLIFN